MFAHISERYVVTLAPLIKIAFPSVRLSLCVCLSECLSLCDVVELRVNRGYFAESVSRKKNKVNYFLA